MQSMRDRRGRPPGEVTSAMLGAFSARPATVREVAASLQIGMPTARATASRLAAAGAIAPVPVQRRAEGRGRPAGVYSVAGGGAAGESLSGLQEVVRIWRL